jgi:acetyltransferase-like isoleucine patch superfamily enzyme
MQRNTRDSKVLTERGGVPLVDMLVALNGLERRIHAQSVAIAGRTVSKGNRWVGRGTVELCGQGGLSLGRNSVVGANSVVSGSFSPFRVLVGNRAKILKRFDQHEQRWVRVHE